MDKEQGKKWNFERDDKRKTKKTIGRKEGFERQACLGNQRGQTAKTARKTFLGLFCSSFLKNKNTEKI